MSGIQSSGDVQLTGVVLYNSTGAKGLDIRPQVRGIQLFESLYYEFITCVVVVEDVGDIVSGMHLVGEEIVVVTANVPTMQGKLTSIALPFHLYSVVNGTKTGDKTRMYTLNCISIEAMVNSNRKFSKGLSGRVSDIASNVIINPDYGLGTKKKVFIEESTNTISYVSNYWTPIKNLSFLSKRAISTSGSSSYMFFENKDGFNFITMEKLYKNAPIANLIKDNNVTKDAASGSYDRIIEMEVTKLFDYYKNIKKGTHASTLNTLDIVKKQVNVTEYSPHVDEAVTRNNDAFPHGVQITVHPSAVINTNITAYGTYEGIADITDSDYKQKRDAILGFSRFQTIKVLVPGRTDYSVGYVVNVTISKNAIVASTEDNIDYLLSGRYIIAEVNHIINSSEYRCAMTLIKDSVKNQ